MKQPGGRKIRLAGSIKRELALCIRAELDKVESPPLVSINSVELSSDMAIAQVFVSVFATDEEGQARGFRILRDRASRLRGPLARRMNLARAPELRFVLDQSLEFQARLTEIVREDERHGRGEDQ